MRAFPLLALTVLVLAPLVPTGSGGAPPQVIQPGFAPEGPVSAIVSLTAPPTPDQLEALASLGEVRAIYRVIDGANVLLDASRLPALARVPGVWRVDPDEPLALHLDTSRPAVRVGPETWRETGAGNGVTVAVVDTGVDANHPGVRDRIRASVVVTGPDSEPRTTPSSKDTDGHGTHVAGIVAGSGARSTLLGGDEGRYAGMATGAGLVPIDISASFTTNTAIRAFDWVHENYEQYGIRVVQNSWGRQEVGRPFDPDDPAVRASNALVFDDGLLLVFSAANEGPEPSTLSMEAMNPNVLTVGAVNDAGRVAEFSSRGPVLVGGERQADWLKPDVVAPGVRITSAASTTGTVDPMASLYKELSGTSQAAPHVAGIAALVFAKQPELGPLEVMELFRRSAVDVDAPGPDVNTGYGLVDAGLALAVASNVTAGDVLLPGEERYTLQGTLLTGVGVLGPLAGGTGAETTRANGTIPVKQGARELRFEAKWSAASPVIPVADLRVTLVDPAGAEAEVPKNGQQATANIAAPQAGTWQWALEIEGSGPGGADYEVDALVLTAERLATGSRLGEGGFFEESPLQQFWREAQAAEPFEGAALIGLAVVGLLAIMLLVGILKVIF